MKPPILKPTPTLLRKLKHGTPTGSTEKSSPGCGILVLYFLVGFALLVFIGTRFGAAVDKPDPTHETALQYKVRTDLEKQDAAKQRAVQESLERNRQRQ